MRTDTSDTSGLSGPARPDWPAWLGRRVAVRYALAAAEVSQDGARLSDAVGQLVEATDPLVLATTRGLLHIPHAAVLAAKVVPPRPSRRGPPHTALAIGDLERVEMEHWRPQLSQDLGGWQLRAHHGVTGRANSALAIGVPPGLPARLDDVRAWYAERDLPPLLALPVPADATCAVAGPASTMPAGAVASAHHRVGHSPDGEQQLALREKVEQGGWGPGGGVSAYTLTAATRAIAGPAADPPSGLRLHRSAAPDDAWCALYRAGTLPDHVRSLLVSAPEQMFVSVLDGADATLAIARGSLADGWAGLTAVEVAPGHRGLARLVVADVARWATHRRIRSVFAQTAAGNASGQDLLLSLGFGVHHRYDYLVPADSLDPID